MPNVAVVIGGGPLDPRAVASLPPDILVVAADSGLDHAVAAGMTPCALVGDMDSISAGGRMWAYAHELRIEEYPTDKEFTDTELALWAAHDLAEEGNLVLLGGVDPADPRPDHLLGVLLALGHPSLQAHTVTANIAGVWYSMVHPGRTVRLPIGAGRTFSVLALHGMVEGLTVEGARWPLENARLTATEARGVSNVAEEEHVSISTISGVATVVVP